MVVVFFPTVAILTFHTVLTTCLFKGFNIIVDSPIGTSFWDIVKLPRISTEILDIVGIDALGTVMVGRVRTPDGFILIYIELYIPFHFSNQFNRDFFIGMSEGAELVVIACLFI